MPEAVNCSLDSKSIHWLIKMLVDHEPATLEALPEVRMGETVIGEMNDTMRRIEACIQDIKVQGAQPDVTTLRKHVLRTQADVLNAMKWVEVSEICGSTMLDDQDDSLVSIGLRRGGAIVRLDRRATLLADL